MNLTSKNRRGLPSPYTASNVKVGCSWHACRKKSEDGNCICMNAMNAIPKKLT
jgi:hypothetical protein